MLDLNFLRNNLELVKTKIEAKGLAFDLTGFQELDSRRRRLLAEAEGLKSKKNALAKEIGILKRGGKESRLQEEQSIELSQANRRPGKGTGRIGEPFPEFPAERPQPAPRLGAAGHGREPEPAGARVGPEARFRLHAPARTGNWASRTACSISSARPRSPARASPSTSTPWPSWSGC